MMKSAANQTRALGSFCSLANYNSVCTLYRDWIGPEFLEAWLWFSHKEKRTRVFQCPDGSKALNFIHDPPPISCETVLG